MYIMIDITITTLSGYNFNIRSQNLNVGNVKKGIYKHFKGLNRDNAYKYHVKYQTLLLNTELWKDGNLTNGDIITLVSRNKTVEQERKEQREAQFFETFLKLWKLEGFDKLDLRYCIHDLVW